VTLRQIFINKESLDDNEANNISFVLMSGGLGVYAMATGSGLCTALSGVFYAA
jgi:hypothetical protein